MHRFMGDVHDKSHRGPRNIHQNQIAHTNRCRLLAWWRGGVARPLTETGHAGNLTKGRRC
jgi:hypothetical protein